jgi:hypothetical protein
MDVVDEYRIKPKGSRRISTQNSAEEFFADSIKTLKHFISIDQENDNPGGSHSNLISSAGRVRKVMYYEW